VTDASADPSGWTLARILPSLDVRDAVEGKWIALVSTSDERVRSLASKHPNFRTFIGRFSDQFGGRLRPGILLLNEQAPPTVKTAEALAGFRDLIVMAYVLRARAIKLGSKVSIGPAFSDPFSFYPWNLDKNFEDLIASNAAQLAVQEVKVFRGQCLPGIGNVQISHVEIDQPLFHALEAKWRQRFALGSVDENDIALFRSLNTANHACMVPSPTNDGFYDVGRLVALWVSAFEILAHPSGQDDVKPHHVMDMMDRAPWIESGSKRKFFKAHASTKPPSKPIRRRTLASWIYAELYKARCRFLHGSPVKQEDLLLPLSKKPLFLFPGPLFRMALASKMQLTFPKPLPSSHDATRFGQWIAERMEFNSYAETFEGALKSARVRRRQSRPASP